VASGEDGEPVAYPEVAEHEFAKTRRNGGDAGEARG
jgi:hypothetical protein